MSVIRTLENVMDVNTIRKCNGLKYLTPEFYNKNME